MKLTSWDISNLSPYVESSGSITGMGNIFEICPGKVTLEDCTRVYPNFASYEYSSCSQLVRRKISAILFPRERTKKRQMTTLFNEVTMRNKSPVSMKCYESLQNGNEKSLSKLPAECTHAIVRDLIYGRKVILTGNYNCDDPGVKPLVTLNADIPFSIRLDHYHLMFWDKNRMRLFTTDGMHILHLHSEGGNRNGREMEWLALRAQRTILDAKVKMLDAERSNVKLLQVPSLYVNVWYEECFFINGLNAVAGSRGRYFRESQYRPIR
ncbi:hypothetical protein GcM3_193036 [Golovinomyces cichoracearum]|uniref:Uncharacterized protein n=1 Tax=Golovinomyces cichoracearum TaxID=62708 RepID=A0A420HH75_9PEZI|nr:hypothetical protein GcM3_193036 [Golovinomyces cichoracearum]